MDERKILLQVLTIIEYQGDKNAFIATFFTFLYLQTIEDLLDTLDPESRKELEQIIRNPSDEHALLSEINTYLSHEDFDKRLEHVTTTQFADYLETIYPTLSPQKQEQLTMYLSTLPKPQQTI